MHVHGHEKSLITVIHMHIIGHNCVLYICLQKTSEKKTRKMMVQTNDDYQDAGPNFPGAYHDLKV